MIHCAKFDTWFPGDVYSGFNKDMSNDECDGSWNGDEVSTMCALMVNQGPHAVDAFNGRDPDLRYDSGGFELQMVVGATGNGKMMKFMAVENMDYQCMYMAMENMSCKSGMEPNDTDVKDTKYVNNNGFHSVTMRPVWSKDDDADDMYYPDKPMMMHGLEKYVMKTSAWQCSEKNVMVIKYDLTTSAWQCLVNTLDVLNYDFKIPGLQCLVKNVKKQFLQSLVNYDFKVYVVKELVENYVEYFVYTVLWMVMGISYNMTFVFKFFMVVAGNCTLLAMGVSWTMSPSRTFLTSGLQRLALAWFTLYQLTEGKVFELSVLTVAVICIMWHGMLSTRWIQRFALDIKHVSRCCKRKQSRQKRICKRQLVVMIFMCFAVNARAMEQQDAMFQRISALAEAATRAAVAAEQVVTQTAGAASSASGDGLQNAAKVLKNPEMFSGEDALAFPSWRFQFTSWLTYGESKYVPMLEKIEKLTSPPDVSTYTAEEKTLAHRLYAVLTSYLKGRCGHMCKAAMKSRDGFAVWYQLVKEFEPSSRQRSLALAQALSNYPSFSKDRSCLESILVYEETVQRFEESSLTKYPDELKIATLMRCCHPKLKEYLQLSVDDSSSYATIKEHILNYERVSRAWSHENVLKSIDAAHKQQQPDPNGPAPMEIDRVADDGYKGGKGKGKGKYKGKGKWNLPWGAGRFGGRGKGKGKGKKGRGRGNAKAKGKGKKGGKHKGGQKGGKAGPNQCKICYGYGHWSNECPHKMDVNQVQQEEQQHPVAPQQAQHQQPGGSPQRGGASSNTTYVQPQAQQARQGTVRRIFHLVPSPPTSPMTSKQVRKWSRMTSLNNRSNM